MKMMVAGTTWQIYVFYFTSRSLLCDPTSLCYHVRFSDGRKLGTEGHDVFGLKVYSRLQGSYVVTSPFIVGSAIECVIWTCVERNSMELLAWGWWSVAVTLEGVRIML